MATGSPVSFWYGTRAQFDAIATKLDTTLYFITDEQSLYKGSVKFSGSGVDTLLTVGTSAPSEYQPYDKYFNTSTGLIYVLGAGGTPISSYTPTNGALYYNADAQRFVTLTFDGSSWSETDIYDAGISVEDGTGLALNGTTVSGLDATTTTKGVVQVGTNISVSNGVISVPVATNAVFGVVKSGDNITNTNGVLSVGKATTSALGVVKIGTNINVDANGLISVPVASSGTMGVVSAGENVTNNNGVLSVSTASTGSKGVIKIASPFSCDSSGVLDIGYASTSTKGVIKIAAPFSVTSGVLGIASASTSAFGVVKISTAAAGLTITNGILSLGNASIISKGVVQINPNDSHITVTNGVISIDEASTSQKGVVQLMNNANSSDMSSETKAITPHAVGQVADGINQEINTKQNILTAGFDIDINNSTVAVPRYRNIVDAAGATVTLQAGYAYKINATTGAKKLITETIPSGQFGMEGHAEIFVADTGWIQVSDNVVLVDELEPNSVNNCTLRFHDGFCLISVEDHVAGFIVHTATGTGNTSLYYGLTTSANEYISVDASLNGHLIETNEAVISTVKEFVGNGSINTTVEGDMTVNNSLSMVECTVKPLAISGTGSLTVANGVLDFTSATSAEPINLTGGVKIGKNVTIIDGDGNATHLDPRTYGTVKKNGTTTPAHYVYGYAQGLTQATSNYVPIILENNVIQKVDALNASKMSCHERRVCVMDDCETQHVNYYLNPEDLNKKLDGTDAKLDGTDGDVMTEFLPAYYLRIQMTPQYDTTPRECILMSNYPFSYTDSGNNIHTAEYHESFKISPDGKTVRPQYMGYYQASTVVDNGVSKLRSISATDEKYIYPTVSLKLGPTGTEADDKDSFLNRAIANGGSVCNNLHYEWLFHLFVCQKLTVHTQDTTKGSLGFGWASTTSWGAFYPRACGYTNDTENFYGGSTYADSRDADMEAMWNGSWIETTTGGVVTRWVSDAAGCVVTTDSTTGKRGISCNRWRSGANTTENPYVYLYTKASEGMPTTSTQLYIDNACTTESDLTISNVNAGTAYANRVTACKYFIENPWGSLWQNLAGMLPICTGDNIGYFKTTSTNRYKELLKIPIGEAGTSRGEDGSGNAPITWVSHVFPATSNWVTTWNMDTFLLLSTGTNVMQDYFYTSTTESPRAGFRGAYALTTSLGGLGCVDVRSAVGLANANLGARLSA